MLRIREIGVLVVRDDKLDVGDDEVTSSEVAEVGECAGTSGMRIQLASPSFPRMVVSENTLF